jgi:iron complex outermembrane recepter protein
LEAITLDKQKQTAARLLALSAVAQAVALSLGATSAFAQTAPAPAPAPVAQTEAEKKAEEDKKKKEAEAQKLQTITVTGIRKGIEDAISVKKNAESIVESISAEDIGKLPEPSVADSIARLPGVTAQRNQNTGRAQSVSVRGLSPEFNAGTFNGRELASSGDSRSVEFDQFPAELIGGATIYKTPHAGVVNQGLASTIDLQTVRPLNFATRAVAVNFRNQKTGIGQEAGEGKGDRFSLSYIDQFLDRKLGVAVGFAKSKEAGARQATFNSWGGSTAEVQLNGQTVLVPNGFGADTETRDLEREGAFAVLQFKPNSNFETSLDFFSSEGTGGLKKTGIEGGIISAGGYDPAGTLSNATLGTATRDGRQVTIATSGTVNNYNGVVRNHIEGTIDKLTAFGLNAKLKAAGFRFEGDLSQSKNERTGERYETTAGQAGNTPNAQRGSISWTGWNGNNPTDVRYTTSLNYADPNVAKLTDVNGWGGGVGSPQAGYVAAPTITDDINAFRLTAKRDLDFGALASVEVGFNASSRSKESTSAEGFLVIKDNPDPYAAINIPGGTPAVAGNSGIPVLSWNPSQTLGSVYQLRANIYGDVINRFWAVKEKVNTLYVKGNLDGQLGGFPYAGNVGLQFQSTDQTSTGFQNNADLCTNRQDFASCARVSQKNDYNDVLPSLNVNFDLGNDMVVRVGAAKVVARPKMSDLRPNLSFGFDNTLGILKGSGGNPDLEPFRANSFDLSFEKYFGGNKGYVSVAAFNKNLTTYIYNRDTTFEFAPFVNPTTNLPVGKTSLGLITRPENGSGGKIGGFELTVNVPFGMFLKPLEGMGVSVNYSNTNSSIKLPPSGFATNAGTASIPLPGLSKEVTNFRLYYERAGFQVALAGRSRSDFLGDIVDFKGDRELKYIKGETTADFQLGYEFKSGIAKGLSLLFQANNITDAKFQQYVNDPKNITEKKQFGKSYLIGANYKF